MGIRRIALAAVLAMLVVAGAATGANDPLFPAAA